MTLRFANRERGFTLIELMVVITLIGIMTALILPEMKGTFGDALLRSTSRELADACGLAYSRAVSFNQPYRLRINPKTGAYAIEKRVRDGGHDGFTALRDVPGGEGKLDSRIKIQLIRPEGAAPSAVMLEPTVGSSENAALPESEAVVGFYPDGTADAGILVLQDRDGFRLALRISSTTAGVRIFPLERETETAEAGQTR